MKQKIEKMCGIFIFTVCPYLPVSHKTTHMHCNKMQLVNIFRDWNNRKESVRESEETCAQISNRIMSRWLRHDPCNNHHSDERGQLHRGQPEVSRLILVFLSLSSSSLFCCSLCPPRQSHTHIICPIVFVYLLLNEILHVILTKVSCIIEITTIKSALLALAITHNVNMLMKFKHLVLHVTVHQFTCKYSLIQSKRQVYHNSQSFGLLAQYKL